ncbi:MAG: hydrogenase iron-sulfur subunit [Deltaproteobacteria bacterium]|nr:hydrogenase iron-sulfur subunit [Deltaproteobacteria bacterium]
MKEAKKELVIFYCHHQAEKIDQFLKQGNGSGDMDLKRIALPCSGKMEVFHLTKALESGAQGVALFGCPEGECRYVVGGQRAKGRMRYAEKILREIDLEEVRVRRFIDGRPASAYMEDFFGWVEKIRSMASLCKKGA